MSDAARLVAWHRELRAAHDRLRDALRAAQAALDDDAYAASRDLLLYCYGFCTALAGHHRGEDAILFPELAARRPDLRPVLGKLRQDHDMIGSLLGQLEAAVQSGASRQQLERHLEGIAAIMESHFRFEERQLLEVLATLDLEASVTEVLGPL